MQKCLILLILITVSLFAAGASLVHAVWLPDGVPVCTASGTQMLTQVIPQGSGGVIITWADLRSGYWDIYAQRLDASGAIRWTLDGAAICAATHHQAYPQLVSDDAGGAIITWYDSRNGNYTDDSYVQRINASGSVMWTANGVALCTKPGRQNQQVITSDGSGGAIITWQDERNYNWDIYAARIDASGTILWAPDGVPVCTAPSSQQIPMITSDGSGGAIITYWDLRNGNWDIYAQRLDASGAPQWTPNGVAICTNSVSQWRPQIVSDGSGGAFIGWEDPRSGNYDIYLQHVDGSGAVSWAPNGVNICAATGDQRVIDMTDDGLGGTCITWQDRRSGSPAIYAQRVDAAGSALWTSDGLAICTSAGTVVYPSIGLTSANNIVVAWFENRTGDIDIFVQSVTSAGSIQWTADGLALCVAPGNQDYPVLASDGLGGATVAWRDYRNANYDIYALGTPGPAVAFDIKPGTCPNYFNIQFLENMNNGNANEKALLKKGGILVTAIPGGEELDVMDIDVASLELNGLPPLRTSFEDVTTPAPENGECPCTTAGPDGFMDLVIQFSRLQVGLSLGDMMPGDVITLTLTGSLDNGTSFEASDCIEVQFRDADLSEEQEGDLAIVGTASPNPFNPTVTITFTLPERAWVNLSVFDAQGRLVKRLIDGEIAEGESRMRWDGADYNGQRVASGVYFYRLKAGKKVLTKKMVLLK